MEKTALICVTVEDGNPDRLAKSYVDACGTCGKAVWHAFSSPKADRIICNRCVGAEMRAAKARGEKIEIHDPTPEQLKEAREFWK